MIKKTHLKPNHFHWRSRKKYVCANCLEKISFSSTVGKDPHRYHLMHFPLARAYLISIHNKAQGETLFSTRQVYV